jgi:hypothetical protein
MEKKKLVVLFSCACIGSCEPGYLVARDIRIAKMIVTFTLDVSSRLLGIMYGGKEWEPFAQIPHSHSPTYWTLTKFGYKKYELPEGGVNTGVQKLSLRSILHGIRTLFTQVQSNIWRTN